MSNFIFSINATLPVFLIMVAGFIFMKLHIFTDEFVRVMDSFSFKILLPIMLALDVGAINFKASFSGNFVLFCFFGTFIMFSVLWIGASIFLKDKSMVGTFAMCSARGSAAVIGVAFANNIFGNAGMTAMMIMASVPLYNIFSVIFLTVCAKNRDRSISKSQQAVKILVGILKNPLILGVFAGMFLSVCEIKLPVLVSSPLTSLGKCATPLALLAMGAAFDIKKAKAKALVAAISTVIKLVILPLIYIPIAIQLKFGGPELIAILTMTGSPTTVACYIMAKNMDNDGELASATVMLSTLFSAVTLTVWVYILRNMGLV